MLRALLFSMVVFCLPPESLAADSGADLSANAALQYWRAFATLPKLNDAEQNKLFADYLTMPLDAHARDLVKQADYSLQVMHLGAALPRCDWGIAWEQEGVAALLPQMMASRVLGSLACIRARIRVGEGRTSEAIDDLVDAMIMARHVSLDGSLIGVLVGYSGESRVNEAIALFLPGLKADTLKDLQKRLHALPQGNRPATGLRMCEEKSAVWFIRKVKETKSTEELLEFFTAMGLTDGKTAEAAKIRGRDFLRDCGGTAAGVAKFAEEMVPVYARIAQKLDLPLDQFEKEFEAESKKQAGNPVFKVFFPAVPKVRQAQARAEVRRALLDAAFAVQLDGQGALKHYPDPVAGGSFEYVPFDGGFELHSKYKGQEDKPLTLTVGKRKN